MNKTSKEKEAVLNVFAALIRPLMRVAFEYGITAGEIAGVVRRSYIEALEGRLQEQKRPTTDARLAAVAGLPRSDVSALRDALRAGAPHSLRATVSLDQITALLTAWHTHQSFSGAYGLATELDLVAARSVEVIDGTTARCLSRAYVPQGADVTRIERMGRFLGVVTANFVHNLLRTGNEPVYFERTVVSDELLSESGRDKFLALAGERGQELLAELDTFLTRLASSEQNESGRKYGVGIYFFEEQVADQATQQQSKKTYDNGGGKPGSVEEIDVLAGFRRRE
jgi:hypothetical protein